MAMYLQRSWARIYHQMWNLAMHDPVARNHYQNMQARAGGGNNTTNQAGGSGGNARDRYCWCFNKNRCKDPGCEWGAQMQVL